MRDTERSFLSFVRETVHRLLTLLGAILFTVAFFLVLPVIQTLNKPPTSGLAVQTVDIAQLDAPDPPPEPEPEEEPEEEPEPPELTEEAPPLDLAQLELALNPGFSDGWLGGDFAVQLNTVVNQQGNNDALFALADLDQKPRVVYQPGPVLNNALKSKTPATVHIVFIVDERGRVEDPKVQKSTDPAFEKAALGAVRKWKFEPGKRNGEPVRFRMRVPITFPRET